MLISLVENESDKEFAFVCFRNLRGIIKIVGFPCLRKEMIVIISIAELMKYYLLLTPYFNKFIRFKLNSLVQNYKRVFLFD